MDKIQQFLPTWLVPASAIGVLCWHADALISDAARRAISSKLRSADLSVLIVVFRSTIKTLINFVYGEKHFSIKCAWRVFLISQLSAFIIFLYVRRHLFDDTYSGIIDTITKYPLYALYQAISLMFVTFVTDYFSVFKTRLFINALSKWAGVLATILIMISDIVISIIIICVVYVFYLIFISDKLESLIGKDISPFCIGIGGLGCGSYDFINLIFIMFFTNCLTIGWVLLFSISIVTLRLALAMDPIFRLFRWLLPVDDLPVRSVGIAASCVFGLALAFGQLLHFIF